MTESFGTVEKTRTGHRIRFVRSFSTSADDLWEAITTPTRVERWLAGLTGDLRIGGVYQVDFAAGTDPEQVSGGSIEACEPPSLLRVTWSFGTQGDSDLEASTTSDGTGSRLSLVHDLPTDQAIGYGAGWHAYLDRLRAELDETEIPDWDALMMSYLSHYQAAVSKS